MKADIRFKVRLERAIRELKDAGYLVRVNSVYRSKAQQRELHQRWEEGDPQVIAEPAPPGRSAHNFGMAADLNLQPEDFDALQQAAEDNGLAYPDPEGDPVHIELPNWRDLTKGWTPRGRLVNV